MKEGIPPVAAQAWQAYNAMEATKQRHFAYLTGLENRYKRYGAPSEQEERLRERLLKEHDVQVSAFKAAIHELRAQDAKAHDDLLAYIARLHDVMASFPREG